MKFKKLSHVLIFCLGIMLMFFAISYLLSFLSNKFFSNSDVGTATPYLFGTINNLILSFIGIFILKKLGKIDILKNKGKGFGYGVILGSIMLCPKLYQVFLTIMYMLDQEPELQPISVIITIVCMFVTVGLYEELIYRGVILGTLEEHFGHKSANDVWKTVILSGIFFGIAHFEHLVDGVGFLIVLNQAIRAAGMGIFWGAVYMRCRNLYSLMFLHAISDIFVTLWTFVAGTPNLWAAMPLSAQVNFTTFIWTFATVIVEILLAMFLLRKKKMAEIIDSDVSLGKSVVAKN